MAETAAHLGHALATRDSATAVLQDYCRHAAPGLRIRAVSLPTGNGAPPDDLRKNLAIGSDEPIALRHVSLRCGNIALSDAWNWYVPSRLTPAMNRSLDTTEIPFGRAVAALGFRRVPLTSATNALPEAVLLRNTALLLRGSDDLPIALVQETYLASGFAALARPRNAHPADSHPGTGTGAGACSGFSPDAAALPSRAQTSCTTRSLPESSPESPPESRTER
ncbi:hypothetical protein [Swaminathania salitolerans]|nr:hypothetical protein [Swaminathania salitolerans]GBQ10445.1 hypothetical protein AA21291_0430 [Swaminathania salitolerans LMG 21291]